jgi:D-alanyl-D-alanine carboxypeptidase
MRLGAPSLGAALLLLVATTAEALLCRSNASDAMVALAVSRGFARTHFAFHAFPIGNATAADQIVVATRHPDAFSLVASNTKLLTGGALFLATGGAANASERAVRASNARSAAGPLLRRRAGEQALHTTINEHEPVADARRSSARGSPGSPRHALLTQAADAAPSATGNFDADADGSVHARNSRQWGRVGVTGRRTDLAHSNHEEQQHETGPSHSNPSETRNPYPSETVAVTRPTAQCPGGADCATEVCVVGTFDPSLSASSMAELAAGIVARNGSATTAGSSAATAIRIGWPRARAEPNPTWEIEDFASGAPYGASVAAATVADNVVRVTVSPAATIGGAASVVAKIGDIGDDGDDGDDAVVVLDPAYVNVHIANAAAVVTVAACGAAASQGNGPAPIVNAGRVLASAVPGPAVGLQGTLCADSKPQTLEIAAPDAARLTAEVLAAQVARAVAAQGRADPPTVVVSPQVDCSRSSDVGSHGWTRAASVRSQSVDEMLNHCFLVSDNLYAESFARALGGDGTLATGLARIEDILVAHGVPSGSFHQADGSGVSRRNLISPRSLTSTLLAAQGPHVAPLPTDALATDAANLAAAPAAAAAAPRNFSALLPVAGVSGTLAGRFHGTILEGRLVGKTGTLTGVSSISGFMPSRTFGTLVFSMVISLANGTATEARAVIDEALVMLAEADDCPADRGWPCGCGDRGRCVVDPRSGKEQGCVCDEGFEGPFCAPKPEAMGSTGPSHVATILIYFGAGLSAGLITATAAGICFFTGRRGKPRMDDGASLLGNAT